MCATDRSPTPFSGLPQTELHRVQYVVFDVDDTVTSNGRLERVAFDAMHRLHEAGVSLVAVTGRPLGWADVFALQWPVLLAVGENGAGWSFRKRGRLHAGYFDAENVRATHQRTLTIIRERAHRDVPEVPLSEDQPARRCDLAFDIGEHHHASPDQLARLSSIIHSEGARVSVSSVHLHAVAGAWDKAQGVVRAARTALNIDLDQTRERAVFIGDSGNDAAAFGFFPYSVGVANVRAHIHSLEHLPKYVTTQERGAGFAEVADRILGAR